MDFNYIYRFFPRNFGGQYSLLAFNVMENPFRKKLERKKKEKTERIIIDKMRPTATKKGGINRVGPIM